MEEIFQIKKPLNPIRATVDLPGSKSLTNRALLLASFCDGEVCLDNVLFSEDGRSFLSCLQQLGFQLQIDAVGRRVKVCGNAGQIPKKIAEINVGSAGTTARFLTAALALSGGEYLIDASEQMKSRPMKPLLQSLSSLGVKFTYLDKEFSLPYRMNGVKVDQKVLTVNAESSSQFLSALLLAGGANREGLTIETTSEVTAKPFVEMTLRMMKEFGVTVINEDFKRFVIQPGQSYCARDFSIEPDLSNACYFWSAALLTGGEVTVRKANYNSLQGDIRFLRVLEQMGARVEENAEGITVCGSTGGKIRGIEADLSDMPDQVLTLAAIAPFAETPVLIKNIEIIRHHESDRLEVILAELKRMGIQVEYVPSIKGLRILPGVVHATQIHTYGDHRVAMAFSLAGLRVGGMEIMNPGCVAKTFPEYFEVFEQLYSD